MRPAYKMSTWVAICDEDIVDYALGSLKDQTDAAARLEAAAAARRARWLALPLTVRIWRRLKYPLWYRFWVWRNDRKLR